MTEMQHYLAAAGFEPGVSDGGVRCALMEGKLYIAVAHAKADEEGISIPLKGVLLEHDAARRFADGLWDLVQKMGMHNG